MDIQTILSNLKIDQLNAMQEAAIDAWKDGSDLILLSPTGSGKTLAYLLPLVSSLKQGVEGVQAVVLVPSRELALQIEQVFKAMGTGFPVMSCYGGRPAMEEHRTMKGISPAVIIGTPGRMNDHLNKENFEAGTVRTLVIDEFDKCLEFGFQDEMAEVIGKLPSLRRRFLLSATDAEEIPRFTGMNRTQKLDFLNPEETVSQRLRLYRVTSPEKDKLETLYKLLCTLGNESTLVFCNHRESVDRVGKYLHSMKVYCETFHGGMEQDDRERALYKFRNGSCHIFVSPTWRPGDWIFRTSAMWCIITCRWPRTGSSIATDVRRAGRRTEMPSSFCMPKNVSPTMCRSRSKSSPYRKRHRSLPCRNLSPYI